MEETSGPESYFPSIEAKYGKTIDEWKRLIRESPGYGVGARHDDLVNMLKTQFGMDHGHADALVHVVRGEDG